MVTGGAGAVPVTLAPLEAWVTAIVWLPRLSEESPATVRSPSPKPLEATKRGPDATVLEVDVTDWPVAMTLAVAKFFTAKGIDPAVPPPVLVAVATVEFVELATTCCQSEVLRSDRAAVCSASILLLRLW